MAATPQAADAAAVEALSPLPPGEEPWLSMDHLAALTAKSNPNSLRDGSDNPQNDASDRDWMLDSSFQRTLDAAEAEKARMRARARPQVVGGPPAEYGPDGLDPALRIAVEGQRAFMERVREQRQEGVAVARTGTPSSMIPIGPPRPIAERPVAGDSSAALFSSVDGVRVVTAASSASREEAAAALPGSDCSTNVPGGALVDDIIREKNETAENSGPSTVALGSSRLRAAAWGDWARRSLPAHRRAALAAGNDARVEAEAIASTAAAGNEVWVTEEELREARGHMATWVPGVPSEDLDGVGR